MKKVLSAAAAIAAVFAMSTTAYATGNGVVGGVVEGVGDVARGVVEGAESVVDGAANTAEDILTPGDNARVADDNTIEEPERAVENNATTNAATANPRTGVADIPVALALGSFGTAAIAAVSRKRK